MKLFVKVVLVLFCLALNACTIAPENSLQDNCLQPIAMNQATVQNFINVVAPRYGLTPDETKRVLLQARIQKSIIKKITAPTEAMSWGRYRALLITPKRIAAGREFLKLHENVFALAQKQYGVPPEIIDSILGIETFYGKNIGNYRVLDALSTLSFDYPKRAEFFQQELASYILLVKKNNWDALSIKGSYAGAFGLTQFMPSSYRHYAVSEEPNKAPNLYASNDAVLSIANYFKKNGWQQGGPIAAPVKISSRTCAELTCNQRKPLYRVDQWKRAGVQVPNNIAGTLPASVVLLTMNDGKQEAWMIFPNFHVITTYNTSINYAMAAFELSKMLREKLN